MNPRTIFYCESCDRTVSGDHFKGRMLSRQPNGQIRMRQLRHTLRQQHRGAIQVARML